MRLKNVVAATAIVAASVGALPSHADEGGGGSWFYIIPSVRDSAIDFTSWATSTGPAAGAFAARFTITGTVVGQGHHLAIADWWSQASSRPGMSHPAHHVYPTEGADFVYLVYTGTLLSPTTGFPTLVCQSTLTIRGDNDPEVHGTC